MPKRQLILLIVALLLNSCAIKRFITTDESDPLNPQSITARYNPKGTVKEDFHQCSTEPGPSGRKFLVYLPEGYYDSDRRYPVLYLIHGARGNETSWFKDGDVTRIVDSLVACGSPQCIVVFPNMNQYNNDRDYDDSRFKRAIESFFDTDGTVEAGFIHDVVDYVDANYRTIPDKEHRHIAGLSVGALQSAFISARNPGIFSGIGLFSPLVKAPPRHGPNKWFYKDLRDCLDAQFLNPPVFYFIGIGSSDFFHPHIRHYRHYLDTRGYSYTYYEIAGGHAWSSWRKLFAEFYEKTFNQ